MSGDRPAPHHWTLVICYGRITLTTHGDLLRECRIEDRLFAYGREGLLAHPRRNGLESSMGSLMSMIM
jgi:hypothetical protein